MTTNCCLAIQADQLTIYEDRYTVPPDELVGLSAILLLYNVFKIKTPKFLQTLTLGGSDPNTPVVRIRDS